MCHFEGNRNADVALGENECDTPGLWQIMKSNVAHQSKSLPTPDAVRENVKFFLKSRNNMIFKR